MSTELQKYTIKDGKLYQGAFLNFPEREIGEITDEKTEDYYQANFLKLETEINELLEKIESQENKGSFLSHLENVKEKITTIEGAGDTEKWYTKVAAVEVELHQQIRKNRERNLAVKQAFIQELEVLTANEDMTVVIDRVKEIKTKWIKVGAVDKELQDELNEKFKLITDTFFERYNESIGKEIVGYKSLITESEELLAKENPKTHKKRIINIQKEWKSLPKIPKNEFVPLFNKLREVHDAFFEKIKDEKSKELGQEQEKNITIKNDIIEEANQLLKNVDNINLKDLKTIQEKWRNSGRVSKAKGDELWDKFSEICERIFELKTLDIQLGKFFRGNKEDKTEVIKFKIKELQNSVRKVQQQLKTVEDNLGSFRLNISSKKIEKQFLSKDKNIERKLVVKQDLINQFKEELKK